MNRGAVVVLVLAAGLFLSLAVVGPAASSPQPTPACPVCGTTLHEDVTTSTATLRMTPEGDVRWHVENELTDPTATEWREHPDRARTRVQERLEHRYRVPLTVSDLAIRMDGDTLVVTFVDEGAARQRLGLLVLPYLHGEGGEPRHVINADRFAVVAPEGHRIFDDPTMATVDGNRAVWRGTVGEDPDAELREAPEPGDTYVVTGSGPATGVGASLVTTFEPLVPGLYATYATELLLLAGLAFGGYTLHGHRLGPRRVLAGVAAAGVPFVLLVASIHPPQGGIGAGFLHAFVFLVALALGLVDGVALYAWAAYAERSRAEESGP